MKILPEHRQVSIELTDDELRMLWYTPGKRKQEIDLTKVIFQAVPIPPGVIEQGQVLQPTELIRILENFRKTHGIEGRVKARIGIPFANSFIREYTLPWVKKRERTPLLTYLAEEEIPISANERVFDSFVLDENSPTRRLNVILSGIRRSVLSGIATSFEAAGFSIEIIEFSLIAWARVLNFEPGEHTLLIKEQMGIFQLIFYKGQLPEITRIIPLAAKHYGAEEWNLEIQRVLAYFSTMHEQVEIHRVVVSQGRDTEDLGRRFCAYLSLEKGIEPNFQVLGVTMPFIPQIENCTNPDKLLAVSGLALEVPKSSFNNFWRGEIKRKSVRRNKWIAFALFCALTFLGLIIRVSTLEKLSELNQENFRLKATGESMERSGKKQEGQARAWNDLLKNPTTVGQDLSRINSLSGNGIWFERLEVKENTLLVKGNASNAILVQQVLNQLQHLDWEKAQLSNYHMDENSEAGLIEFTMKAERLKK